MSDRALPLPKVTGIYERAGRYPDVIKVQMSDNSVVQYRIDNGAPHPSFTAEMKNLERMKNA